MTPFRDGLALGLEQRPRGSCLPRAWVKPRGREEAQGAAQAVWEDLQEQGFDK